MEKIIFRTERNRYIDGVSFLAIYPECSACPGHYAARPFHFETDWRGNEKAVFESFCEVSRDYYYRNTRIVHKKDSVVKKLLSAIQQFDNCNYLVCERNML